MNYKAAFHIDLEDDHLLTLALGNITNSLAALEGTESDFILLANGPAVTLLAGEHVKKHLEQIATLAEAGVRFQACNNALQKYAVAKEDLAKNIEVIPAGIIGLIDLQNSGFAYIKP